MRTQVVPRLAPLALILPWVRRFVLRTISQITIACPDLSLSQDIVPDGGAGGMRLV